MGELLTTSRTTSQTVESSLGASAMHVSLGDRDAATRNKHTKLMYVIGTAVGVAALLGTEGCSTTVNPSDHPVHGGNLTAPAETISGTPVPAHPSSVTEPPCKIRIRDVGNSYESVTFTFPNPPDANDSVSKAEYKVYSSGSTDPSQTFDRNIENYGNPLVYLGTPGDTVTLTIDFESKAEVICSGKV